MLSPNSLVLCPTCSSLLELISPDERCPICFHVLEDEGVLRCAECSHQPSHYLRMGAAFNYNGVAASLVKRLKYSQQPHLAKGMAAFLFAQFDRLQWPMPDALIPVPISFTHWLERGYNQSALLAKEMGLLLERPIWQLMSRQSGDFSQAALNFEQRKALESNCFNIKSFHSHALHGKILLVIDDVMTSGLTLQRCAEVLQKEQPAALYALTFCRTLKL